MRSAGYFTRLTVFAVSLLLFGACDSLRFWEDDTAPIVTTTSLGEREVLDVRKRATVIQSTIERLDRKNLPTFSRDGSRLDVSMYYEDGELRLIDERIQRDDGSRERNRYYFDDAAFFHFYGQAQVPLMDGVPGSASDIRTRMYFNDNGNLFHSEKTIDGLQSDLEESELPNTMRRAFALRELRGPSDGSAVDTVAFHKLLDDDITDLELPETIDEEMIADVDAVAEEPDMSEAPEEGVDAANPDETAAVDVPVAQKTKPATAPKRQTAVRKEEPRPASTKKTKSRTATPAEHQEAKVTTPPPPKKAAPPPPAPVPADEVLITPHTHAMLPGTLSSHRIRFQKGFNGATLSATVRKGRHKEYVLRARRGQTMSVALQSKDPDVYFRVFLNDGDISGQRRAWSGSLPRYGDYHIVVYRRSDAAGDVTANYTVSMNIK